MPDALPQKSYWTVEFRSGLNLHGNGLIMLDGDRVYGADDRYMYSGTWRFDGDRLVTELDVVHCVGEPLSVYGQATFFKLELSGIFDPQQFKLGGHIKDFARSPGDLAVLLKRAA
jgi:hypothetical protein